MPRRIRGQNCNLKGHPAVGWVFFLYFLLKLPVYGGTEETIDDYEIDKMKGEITKKVPVDVFPSNNQSNVFEAGTIVYSVKGEDAFIIVEDPEGQKHLLQRSPGTDNE